MYHSSDGGSGGVEKTTWEKYLKERKRKKKEKRSKIKEIQPEEGEGKEDNDHDVGFDDPFFQHDITTATARSKKTKRSKLSQEKLERDKKEKSELELLMLEEKGEEGESSRQHFHLPAIMKEERDSNKKNKQLQRLRRQGQRDRDTEEEQRERDTAPPGPRDGFQIDLTDPRFSALYESHLYAPDPANPSYKATKAMDSIMKERQKRSQHRSISTSKQKNTTSKSLIEPSIVSLVKSVKSKSSSFKEKQRKRKNRKQF